MAAVLTTTLSHINGPRLLPEELLPGRLSDLGRFA